MSEQTKPFSQPTSKHNHTKSNEDREQFQDLFPGEELSEKHWNILEAAVRVFSKKGFSASRTSEVAKEAGVSEGTIFNYFKTKKDLLHGMLTPLYVRFFRPFVLGNIEKIFDTRKEQPFEEVMNLLMRDRIDLITKNLPLVKTVAAEAAFHPDLLDPIKTQVMPKALEIGKQYLQEEIEKGNIRDIDPETALRVLMSIVFGHIVVRHALSDVFHMEDEETEIRRVLDIYLHGVKRQDTVQD